ncbi:hypothetical protein IY73_04600 [Lawsonella clevelandensis]|nr:hypothetical protein IY73_04600 [Lawsonella clevelandensis]
MTFSLGKALWCVCRGILLPKIMRFFDYYWLSFGVLIIRKHMSPTEILLISGCGLKRRGFVLKRRKQTAV